MLRELLRKSQTWIKFQQLNQEGWSQALRRLRIQREILSTAPIRTAPNGPREVRLLTWRRGWLDALWALKSFYVLSGVDYPLVIHDGGLEREQFRYLKEHFPDCTIVTRDEANGQVREELRRRELPRSLLYRSQNIATLKVWDFFLLSRAEHVISIDSDIVFFKRPSELLGAARKNLFNKDMQYAYSMSLEELELAFGVKPPPLINSGLSLVARESMNFVRIEEWLGNGKLFADKWVTEQTLHALSSALHGVELLPDSYCVSTEAGLRDHLICKHYPGFFRPLLYSEGMPRVRELGVLKN